MLTRIRHSSEAHRALNEVRQTEQITADRRLADAIDGIAAGGGVRGMSREAYQRARRDLRPLLRNSSGRMPPWPGADDPNDPPQAA
jgi:hypothetical protein